MKNSIIIFGSWVLGKKTNILSTAKAGDIDVIIKKEAKSDNVRNILNFLSNQGKKIDIHFTNEVKGLGIFKNEPFFKGESLDDLKKWLENENKKHLEVTDLKSGIAHRIRGSKYFNNLVEIPNYEILTSSKPWISSSRYDGELRERNSLIHLGATHQDGSRFSWARYSGGFSGNSVAAILAALRKFGCCKNNQVKQLQRYQKIFEEGSDILNDPSLPALEGSVYGPRCNIEGLKQLIKSNELKNLVREQSNRV